MRDFPKVSQTILYTGEMVNIGSFSASPDAPRFHNTGPIGGYLIVFPSVPVLITHAGGSPITATPNRVMFYNHGQEYRRDRLSPQGDQSHWFAFAETVVRDVLLTEPGGKPARGSKPFLYTHGPVDAACYARQRQLVAYLYRCPQPDSLLVEETALSMLGAVLDNAGCAWHGACATHSVNRNRPDLTTAAVIEQILAVRFREGITLQAIAAEIHYSPFHLSRVFHQQTGKTIHQYLNQLRLRTAFDEILCGQTDLTQLALDLGFSSHSHFTQAFRRTFGKPPSQVIQSPFPFSRK